MLPEQANFEEIGPEENDLANFLSVHLTNPYSDNMAEPQQTRRHSPPGRRKVRMSYICHGRIDANLTVASRWISNESVGTNLQGIGNFFPGFQSRSLDPKDFCMEVTGTPRPSVGFPRATHNEVFYGHETITPYNECCLTVNGAMGIVIIISTSTKNSYLWLISTTLEWLIIMTDMPQCYQSQHHQVWIYFWYCWFWVTKQTWGYYWL